jgi:CheY-like chemotaxis protein
MAQTVLIAEDYDDIRAMTKIMLETLGYNVLQARDGFEALELARDKCPDLILMDIAMPIMNGITAATIIRSLQNCRDIPIIALTAYGNDYAESAGDFGFDAVLQKPIRMEGLEDLLKWHLGPPPQHPTGLENARRH